MMYRRLRQHLDARLLPATGILVALLLAGCATTPPAPTARLQAAQQAIASAERIEAGAMPRASSARHAPSSPQRTSAMSEKRMILAGQFADEARAEAELASARTSDAKATAVNDEMKRNTDTLVEEMKRSTGDKP